MAIKGSDLKLEDLSQSDIEFLNKIPIGTIARVKKDEIQEEINKLADSEATGKELFDKVKGGSLWSEREDITTCCHASCNCALWG